LPLDWLLPSSAVFFAFFFFLSLRRPRSLALESLKDEPDLSEDADMVLSPPRNALPRFMVLLVSSILTRPALSPSKKPFQAP
jgi:hypothetical protein